MKNEYLECRKRVEAFYQTLPKEELIKRLMWELSVSDITRMGTPKKEVD
mgnify:CR=1 FL=1|jgi:hypothetical protein|tara:strand:+ start:1169 stop:1315 length:147 start_codon:yes stop_codon:yes gene_type:complete